MLMTVVDAFKETAQREATAREKIRSAKGLHVLTGGERPHKRARNPHPQYPKRGEVPDDKVRWSVAYDSYAPWPYTADSVLDNDRSLTPRGETPAPNRGWADPDLPWGTNSDGDFCTLPFPEAFAERS